MAKFVICSHARIGSYMLATALDAHPDASVAGEVFQGPRKFGLPNVKCVPPLSFAEQPDRKAADAHVAALEACGFLGQAFARYDGFIASRLLLSAWRYLDAHLGPDTRIIFLDRLNLLRAFCSLKVGLRDYAWHAGDRKASLMLDSPTTHAEYDASSRGEVHVDLDEFSRYLCEYRLLLESFRARLRRFRVMEVTYEYLCTDWSSAIRRVQAFLDLSTEDLQPATRKQEIRPLSAIVANYSEVVDYLSRFPFPFAWDRFYDEEGPHVAQQAGCTAPTGGRGRTPAAP